MRSGRGRSRIRTRLRFGVPTARRGRPGRGRWGFRGGNGIAWPCSGLMQLFAEPLRLVDIRFEGRGRGFRGMWGKAAIGDESLDRCDHRKSFDLAGDAASGLFVAESGELPEPVEDLVATNIQLAQLLELPGLPAFP